MTAISKSVRIVVPFCSVSGGKSPSAWPASTKKRMETWRRWEELKGRGMCVKRGAP